MRKGMLVDGFWEPETAKEFTEPNCYHWYLGMHGAAELLPDWQMHLDLMLPALSEKNAYEKANALQALWLHNKAPQESYPFAFESPMGV